MNILRMHIICIAYAEYSAKYADDVDAEYEDDIMVSLTKNFRKILTVVWYFINNFLNFIIISSN